MAGGLKMSSSRIESFKKRLLDGEKLIGMFSKTPSSILAEVVSQTNLDVVCIDAEHAPFDRRDIDQCVFAYRSSDMPSLVRIPSCRPEYILNALDCGASGVIIPHVNDPKVTQECVNAAYFGEGGRGYAGSSRFANYGTKTLAENIEKNKNDTTVIAQIEDLKALDHLDEIFKVDGIDCFFIGMMDLTVALNAQSHKDTIVVDTVKKICNTAQKYNRRVGLFTPDIDSIEFWQSLGASLFLLGSDHQFLKNGIKNFLSSI